MSKFFINRPIVAMVISIIMVIVGLVTLVGLPVAQFPKVVPPEIFIQANYVGADAQTVEESVATPIEQQMSGVDNMNYMYSVNSSTGEVRLTLILPMLSSEPGMVASPEIAGSPVSTTPPPGLSIVMAGPVAAPAGTDEVKAPSMMMAA